jgi:hypothetical protein
VTPILSSMRTLRHPLILSIVIAAGTGLASAQAPGGFLEPSSSTAVRPRLTTSQIASLVPAHGPFTFGAPYHTQASRITNGTDCGGADCLFPVGYSYWRNMNAHAGRGTILIFLGLSADRGGSGPTLFEYDKTTGAVTNRGALFDTGSYLRYASAEGWYFSGSHPTALYLLDGPRLARYDVETRAMTTVFDVTAQYPGAYVWQAHSSDDDRVHSVTLRSASGSVLGCLVHREDTGARTLYPAQGAFDECSVDKSGHWLVILENVDNRNGVDNRIINLDTGAESVLLDEAGAMGHCDVGHGYIVGEDDWASEPGTARLWRFGEPLTPGATQGLAVYHTMSWSADLGHISHGNAKAGTATGQQFACSSNATRQDLARSNEIVCYRLDDSQQVLVVAPVMSNLDAPGGYDDYGKRPKGNLDTTGGYFLWTTNLGGGRLDAFVVRVPSQLLISGGDTTPPSVSVTSPANGSSVSGNVTVVAGATDASGIAGVQFRLDGANLGPEVTSPPYQTVWSTAATPAGAHALTAVARDAHGNTATSPAVTVTVGANDTSAPVLSSIAASGITAATAAITWTTNEGADSQVDYGPTTAYGQSTSLDPALLTAHAQSLSGLSASTVYHYRVRSRDAAGNPSVSTDRTFVTAAGAVSDVGWTNLVACAASGGTLTKTGGGEGLDDARAVSVQQIAAGDGGIEFTASDITATRFAGLTTGAGGTGWAGIDFAVRLGPWTASAGVAEVRERGVWKADITYVAGDRIRVAVSSGVVRYFKNGVAFHVSAKAPLYPLRGDAAIFSIGGRIANASFTLGASPRPQEVGGVRAVTGRFEWDVVPAATSYHVYRGAISSLPSGAGTCSDALDPDRTDTRFTDTEVPQPRTGWFYLFSAQSPDGEGSLGYGGSGGERIAAATCL